MNRVTFAVLLLSALLLPSVSVAAEPQALNLGGILRSAGILVTVPPEWDGIWTTEDSTYDCTTGPTGTSSGKDTLCAGQVLDQGSAGAGTFVCSGTADATTYHVTCNGGMEVIPNCQATYDMVIDGVRTADSYRAVATLNVTYAGTAEGCDQIPASCTRIVTYGTRTGPAPSAYCATPVSRVTWGKLKILYR